MTAALSLMKSNDAEKAPAPFAVIWPLAPMIGDDDGLMMSLTTTGSPGRNPEPMTVKGSLTVIADLLRLMLA